MNKRQIEKFLRDNVLAARNWYAFDGFEWVGPFDSRAQAEVFILQELLAL